MGPLPKNRQALLPVPPGLSRGLCKTLAPSRLGQSGTGSHQPRGQGLHQPNSGVILFVTRAYLHESSPSEDGPAETAVRRRPDGARHECPPARVGARTCSVCLQRGRTRRPPSARARSVHPGRRAPASPPKGPTSRRLPEHGPGVAPLGRRLPGRRPCRAYAARVSTREYVVPPKRGPAAHPENPVAGHRKMQGNARRRTKEPSSSREPIRGHPRLSPDTRESPCWRRPTPLPKNRAARRSAPRGQAHSRRSCTNPLAGTRRSLAA